MDTTDPLCAESRASVDQPAPNGAVPRRTVPNGAEPVPLAVAASQLGLSVDALRRRMKSSGVMGQMVAAPHGGRLRILSPADLAALRSAPNGAEPIAGPARDGAEPRASAPNGQVDPADGWRLLVAELTADRDRLRSELATVTVARQEALRRAESAEVALRAGEVRHAALRAACASWLAALVSRPLWRLRRLPPLPPELVSGPLLTS